MIKDPRLNLVITPDQAHFSPVGNSPEQPYRATQIEKIMKQSKCVVPHKITLEDIAPLLASVHTQPYIRALKQWSDTSPLSDKFVHDSSSPFAKDIWHRACTSAKTAITGAQLITTDPHTIAFAVTRPPGHHAMRDKLGGFCYLNNTALAAQYLSINGKVAILDIDFHHGNGTQDIFYEREDVLTISLHGNPKKHYPFDSGFIDETGTGHGKGFNFNFPLPDYIQSEAYLEHLDTALEYIKRFSPSFLVIALGFDTFHRDLLGTFSLEIDAYPLIGARIKELSLPTLAVLEGGYHNEIGDTAHAFFSPWLQ